MKRNNGGQRSYAAATSSAIVSSDHAEMTTGKNKPRSGRAGKNVRTGWKTVQARPNTGARSNGAPGDTLTSSPSPSPNTKQSQRARVKIPNARKIWGTMRSCSAVTVANTIAQLCPTFIGKLQVRRKFKSSNSGIKSRWWFVVHGEEEVLIDLVRSWEAVTLQTSWKLQDCLKYNDESTQCSDGTPRSLMSDHDNAGSDPVCHPNPTVTIATPPPANLQQSVSQHVPLRMHSGKPFGPRSPRGTPSRLNPLPPVEGVSSYLKKAPLVEETCSHKPLVNSMSNTCKPTAVNKHLSVIYNNARSILDKFNCLASQNS